jgi:hypothetical protein
MIHGSAGPKANELPPCYLSDAIQDAGNQQCDDQAAEDDEAKKAHSHWLAPTPTMRWAWCCRCRNWGQYTLDIDCSERKRPARSGRNGTGLEETAGPRSTSGCAQRKNVEAGRKVALQRSGGDLSR